MSRSRNTWLIHSLINWLKKFEVNFSSVSRTCEPGVTYYIVVLVNAEIQKMIILLQFETLIGLEFDKC